MDVKETFPEDWQRDLDEWRETYLRFLELEQPTELEQKTHERIN